MYFNISFWQIILRIGHKDACEEYVFFLLCTMSDGIVRFLIKFFY